MSLHAIPGVHGLCDAAAEGDVDGVVLRPHLVRRLLQGAVDVAAQALRRVAFPLRPEDVVVAELGPALGHGHAEEREREGKKHFNSLILEYRPRRR